MSRFVPARPDFAAHRDGETLAVASATATTPLGQKDSAGLTSVYRVVKMDVYNQTILSVDAPES